MRAGRRSVPLLVAAALAVPACGGDDSPDEPPPAPAELVPRDAYLYAETVLRLRGEAGRAARSFIARVTGQRTVPDGALLDELGEALDLDVRFRRGASAWVGQRGALFMLDRGDDPYAAGLVFDVADADRARRFLRSDIGRGARRVSYRGVTFWRGRNGRAAGLVRGRAVLGSSTAVVRAAIDTRRASLASTERYRRLRKGDTPPFLLAMADAEARAALLAITPFTPAERRALTWFWPRDAELLIELSVEERQAVARVHGLRSPARTAPPIKDFPGDAWVAISSGDLGANHPPQLPSVLDVVVGARFPRSILRAVERGTFFAQQQPGESAGELLGTVSDRRAVARSIRAFGQRLRLAGTHKVRFETPWGGVLAFTATARRPAPVYAFGMELIGRDLELSFGGTGAPDSLSETRAYREATRAFGREPTTLVNVRELVRLIDPTGSRDLGPLQQIAFMAATEPRVDKWSHYLVQLVPGKPKPGPLDDEERLSWLAPGGAATRLP
jgi:hypothetical protein